MSSSTALLTNPLPFTSSTKKSSPCTFSCRLLKASYRPGKDNYYNRRISPILCLHSALSDLDLLTSCCVVVLWSRNSCYRIMNMRRRSLTKFALNSSLTSATVFPTSTYPNFLILLSLTLSPRFCSKLFYNVRQEVAILSLMSGE